MSYHGRNPILTSRRLRLRKFVHQDPEGAAVAVEGVSGECHRGAGDQSHPRHHNLSHEAVWVGWIFCNRLHCRPRHCRRHGPAAVKMKIAQSYRSCLTPYVGSSATQAARASRGASTMTDKH
jgi:hypothetical protein